MRRGAALAAVSLVLLAAAVAHAQTIRWTMANEYPATSIQGEADARFTREVLERTGGRIAITNRFDAASGFRSVEMVQAIGRGTLVIGNTFMGAAGALDPVFLLPSLPFLASTPAEGRVLAEVARRAFEAALGRQNQKLLFLSPWPPAGLWTKAPVTTLRALKGLRVRTSDASGVIAFETAGAAPVLLSFADTIPMLRAGKLDAVVSSGDGGAGSRFAEVLRHFTAIDYATTLSMVTINADAWHALEPSLQASVLAAAAATEAKQWELLPSRIAMNDAQMRAAGVTVVRDVSADLRRGLRAAGKAAVDDWLRRMGPAGSAILNAYRRGAAAPRRRYPVCTRLDGESAGFGYPDNAPMRARRSGMSSGTAKEKVLEVVQKLPPDATLEDAIERLVLLAKTERGLAELDAGQGVDHAEAKRRLLR